MTEPGLDLHEWETRWAELEDAAHESASGALVEMDRLVEAMLVESGYSLDPVVSEGEEPEIVRQFLAARDVARLADAGEADPGDVGAAIESYRAIYESLISERSA